MSRLLAWLLLAGIVAAGAAHAQSRGDLADAA
jgi:hypothetical protein